MTSGQRRLQATPEVAEESRVSEEKARSLVRTGGLQAIRTGRGRKEGFRFTRQALGAYLAKQTTRRTTFRGP